MYNMHMHELMLQILLYLAVVTYTLNPESFDPKPDTLNPYDNFLVFGNMAGALLSISWRALRRT